MLTLLVRYSFPSLDKRDAFLADARNEGIGTASRGEAGCLDYAYYLPARDTAELLLFEKWESEAAQTSHRDTPHFARLAEIKAMYGAETEIRRYLE